MGVLSNQTKFYMADIPSGTTDPSWNEVTNLLEVPSLGRNTDKIEVTTLSDTAHTYMNGLENYGDGLAFKFLYDAIQYAAFNTAYNTEKMFQVAFNFGGTTETPTSNKFTFRGKPSVALDAITNGTALQYTLTIVPTSAITYSNT